MMNIKLMSAAVEADIIPTIAISFTDVDIEACTAIR